jgi:hypothetical protein
MTTESTLCMIPICIADSYSFSRFKERRIENANLDICLNLWDKSRIFEVN